MYYSLFEIIEFLGTIAFAISGTFTAMERRLDLFGVLIIAFVTSIGGGTLRDLLIGNTPVLWMQNVNYCLLILVTSGLSIIFKSLITNFKNTLFLFDSLGLGLFTVIGIEKGFAVGLHPGICIALGTITGCFGGVIRDTLLNRIPLIFRKEIYATACILGGILYYFQLQMHINTYFSTISTIIFIVLVRIIAVKYHLSLGNIYFGTEKD